MGRLLARATGFVGEGDPDAAARQCERRILQRQCNPHSADGEWPGAGAPSSNYPCDREAAQQSCDKANHAVADGAVIASEAAGHRMKREVCGQANRNRSRCQYCRFQEGTKLPFAAGV